MNAPLKSNPGIHDVIEQGFDAAKGYIDRSLITAHERIKQLETRVADLEASPRVDYRGIFDPAERYKRGDMCTDSSAVWFCVTPTQSRPGKSADWRLMLKAGGGR